MKPSLVIPGASRLLRCLCVLAVLGGGLLLSAGAARAATPPPGLLLWNKLGSLEE
jgi:hypothetical protein